jgi:hypothetical protein
MAEKKVPYQVNGRQFEGMIVHDARLEGRMRQHDRAGAHRGREGLCRAAAGFSLASCCLSLSLNIQVHPTGGCFLHGCNEWHLPTSHSGGRQLPIVNRTHVQTLAAA